MPNHSLTRLIMRDNSTLLNDGGGSVGSFNEESRNIEPGELMSQTIRFKKMCNGKDMQIVDNKTFMHSINQMKCMSGYQTVKAKYAADAKPFLDSKTNLEIMTKFKNVEFPSSGAGVATDTASSVPVPGADTTKPL